MWGGGSYILSVIVRGGVKWPFCSEKASNPLLNILTFLDSVNFEFIIHNTFVKTDLPMQSGKAARHRRTGRTIYLRLPLNIDPPPLSPPPPRTHTQGHGADGLFTPLVIFTLAHVGIRAGLLTGHWPRKCSAVPSIYT